MGVHYLFCSTHTREKNAKDNVNKTIKLIHTGYHKTMVISKCKKEVAQVYTGDKIGFI